MPPRRPRPLECEEVNGLAADVVVEVDGLRIRAMKSATTRCHLLYEFPWGGMGDAHDRS